MKRREDRVTEGLPVLVSAEPTNDFRNLAKQICSMKMLGARLASHVPVLDLESPCLQGLLQTLYSTGSLVHTDKQRLTYLSSNPDLVSQARSPPGAAGASSSLKIYFL